MNLVFKEWLEPILAQREIKVTEFCRGVSISRESFYRYYKGKMMPSPYTWMEILDYLQLESTQLPPSVKLFKKERGRPKKQYIVQNIKETPQK